MDDHGQLEYATARGNDYPGHEQTYRTFVTLTRIAVAVVVEHTPLFGGQVAAPIAAKVIEAYLGSGVAK